MKGTVYGESTAHARVCGRGTTDTHLESSAERHHLFGGALPRANKPHQEPADWRPGACSYLDTQGFDGVILTPERREGASSSYVNQADWEQEAQEMADVLVYYLVRTEDVLALSTNTEFGQFAHFGPRRVVLIIPADASLALKTEFQQHIGKRFGIEPIFGLEAGLTKAMELIGEGAERFGGECRVPLQVWRTPSFQSWNDALKAAGNRLDGFKLEFILCPVPQFVLYWGAKVNIWVAKEERHKSNEWVISRPDISHVVLVYRDGLRTQLVGVREFRSTVRNPKGFVYEAAGGSSTKPGIEPIDMALDEVFEETGLRLDREQVRFVGSRQLAATTTAHHAHVCVAELSAEQFAWARKNQGAFAGNRAETEMTALTVQGLSQMLDEELVDWSNVGMAAAAVLNIEASHQPPYTVDAFTTRQLGVPDALLVLDSLNGSALEVVTGLLSTGTSLGYCTGDGDWDGRLNPPMSFNTGHMLKQLAESWRQKGLNASFNTIHPIQFPSWLERHARESNMVAYTLVGDAGLTPESRRQIELVRQHGIRVIGSWAGSTPQPTLQVTRDGSLVATEGGYAPLASQWSGRPGEFQVCGPDDYALVSVARLTLSAYQRLAGLLIGGTHLVYGGAPVSQDAPAGRVHVTRSLERLAAALNRVGIPARFTSFEESDVETRRLQLLALAQRTKAPLLAFVDDYGLAPGVAQECEWAAKSGLPVVGIWAGSSGGVELNVGLTDAPEVNPASLQAMAQLHYPQLTLA